VSTRLTLQHATFWRAAKQVFLSEPPILASRGTPSTDSSSSQCHMELQIEMADQE